MIWNIKTQIVAFLLPSWRQNSGSFPFFFVLQRVSALMDDFRVRIFASTHTPYHIQKMQENLIGAILKGEVLRLDEFRTELKLSGLSKIILRGDVGEDAKSEADGNDEFRVTAMGNQYHVVNTEGRYYTFGNVVAQLRRNWAHRQGSFTMIAQDSRWTRVYLPHERHVFPFFSQLLFSIIRLLLDLFTLYDRPMSFLDLYVTRADVTFDDFRIRDSELVTQVLEVLELTLKMHGLGTMSAWGNIVLDMVLNALK